MNSGIRPKFVCRFSGDRLVAVEGFAGDIDGAGCGIARIDALVALDVSIDSKVASVDSGGERLCCGEIGAVNAGIAGVTAAAVNESGPGMPGTNGINLPP